MIGRIDDLRGGAVLGFLTERHLATLTTLRADGRPQVAPVGVTWDPDNRLARVITWAAAPKVRAIRADPRVALCQVDGARWLTLEGTAVVTDDEARVAEAVRRYTARYRAPKERSDRVAIEVSVERVVGSASLLGR